MKKIKQIKKILKKNDLYKKYIIKYRHPQMKYLPSKILKSLNEDIHIDELIKVEKEYLNADKSKGVDMFSNTFKNFEKISGFKAEWEWFSKMIFYVYQTSTYFWDQKHNIENIFNEDIIFKNSNKRKAYYTWMDSLDFKNKETNKHLINILKLVL